MPPLHLAETFQLHTDQQLGAPGDTLQQPLETAVQLDLPHGGVQGRGAGLVEGLAELAEFVVAVPDLGQFGVGVDLLAVAQPLHDVGQPLLELECLGTQPEDPAAQHAGEAQRDDQHQQHGRRAHRAVDHHVGHQTTEFVLGGGDEVVGVGAAGLQQRGGHPGEALLPLLALRGGDGRPAAAVGVRRVQQALLDRGLPLPVGARQHGPVGLGPVGGQLRHDLVAVDVLLAADRLGQLEALLGGEPPARRSGGDDRVLAREHLQAPLRVEGRADEDGRLTEADVAEVLQQMQARRDHARVGVERLLPAGGPPVHGVPVVGQLLQTEGDLLEGLGERGRGGADRFEALYGLVGARALPGQLGLVGLGVRERRRAEPPLRLEVVEDGDDRGAEAFPLLVAVMDGPPVAVELGRVHRAQGHQGETGHQGQDEQDRP